MQKIYFKGLVTKSEEGKYKVLASTAAVDRHGDIVDQNGWDLTNYKANPVMLWAHNYSELPVAKATGIEITELGLEAEFEFAPSDANPKAAMIQKLYDDGFLNAVSVGFIPKERKGNVITKSELLEISFVPVPANQEALRLAMKSMDISLLPELKGAVSDQLTAEEIWEEKYKKWNGICDILSAFWTVFFDENTPVENFNPLLNETITLLQELADSDSTLADEEDEEKALVKTAISPESTQKFLTFTSEIAEKSGRTLSKKTIESLEKAIDSIKGAATVLEELKSSSVEQDGTDEPAETAEEKIEEAPTGIVLSEEDMKQIRQSLVANDKSNELALSIVNAHLRASKSSN